MASMCLIRSPGILLSLVAIAGVLSFVAGWRARSGWRVTFVFGCLDSALSLLLWISLYSVPFLGPEGLGWARLAVAVIGSHLAVYVFGPLAVCALIARLARRLRPASRTAERPRPNGTAEQSAGRSLFGD